MENGNHEFSKNSDGSVSAIFEASLQAARSLVQDSDMSSEKKAEICEKMSDAELFTTSSSEGKVTDIGLDVFYSDENGAKVVGVELNPDKLNDEVFAELAKVLENYAKEQGYSSANDMVDDMVESEQSKNHAERE